MAGFHHSANVLFLALGNHPKMYVFFPDRSGMDLQIIAVGQRQHLFQPFLAMVHQRLLGPVLYLRIARQGVQVVMHERHHFHTGTGCPGQFNTAGQCGLVFVLGSMMISSLSMSVSVS